MKNLSCTGILKEYKVFSKDFWLAYKSLEKVMDPVRFNEIKLNLMRSKRIDKKYFDEINIDQYNIEKELLRKEWEDKSNEAKTAGTALHEIIHNMFCTELHSVQSNLGVNLHDYLIAQTELFLNTEYGLFPEFRMEIPLSEDYLLVGIADLIIKEQNKITIIDWKSNEKISTKAHFDLGAKKTKSFSYPLSKFDDCDLVWYQLLLSLYGWMVLQLNPDLEIKELKIIQVKDLKAKNIYPVEYVKTDIDKLLKWHIKNAKMKEEMNKCKESQFI